MTPPPPPHTSGRRLLLAGLAFIALMTLPLPLAGAFTAVALTISVTVRWAARLQMARDQRLAAADPAVTRLGAEASGRPVLLPDRSLSAHGLILGATGAGKSTTLLAILSEQIARGRPVIAIDLKGSPTFARELEAAATAAGRPFRLWTADGATYWNPLAHGNATELKDKLIATERFTEPHYKRAAERYVQMALQVMREVAPDRAATLADVVMMLDPARLGAATRHLPFERGEYVRSYLTSLTPDQLSAVRGLNARLAILTESHTGRYLQPPPDGAWPQTVDVRRALDGGEVTVFSLNSSTYGSLAAQLGTLAVQDLVGAAGARLAAAGARGDVPTQAVVGIDEFSALGSDNVMALLARGRESGVGVLLATQELADLDRAARGLRDQVLGNTAIKIAHRQDVPESAQAVARLAGQVKDWDVSYQSQPGLRGSLGATRTSARLVDRYAIEPEQVRTLRTGEAVVIVKSPDSSARVARISPNPQRSRNSHLSGSRGSERDGPER